MSFTPWLYECVTKTVLFPTHGAALILIFGFVDASEWYLLFIFTGIFSDTHLLTMMYIGEMCFWAVKYEDCNVDSMERKEDRLQFRDIGTQILHKYVSACEGPLHGQGWNTENAKEILSILQ